MRRNERNHTGAALLFATLLMGLPFVVACGGASHNGQAQQTVQVRITDQGIEMPPSLPSGVTTFKVTNAGTTQHSFGITGPSGDQKLEAALKPGESGALDIVLDAGTYRVYSPDETMQVALNVRPETIAHSRNG
ncbi:MAG TPA: hypothetical protein VF173_15230 [Thermoanaerobaculia bacterium]|nr:hypothetical protein [Thermoanaerobaculia bacterium]